LNPQVVVALGSEIYVAWISGAFEEFAGNLTLASSSDGGDTFDLMTVDVGNNATYVATAARSGGSLCTWPGSGILCTMSLKATTTPTCFCNIWLQRSASVVGRSR